MKILILCVNANAINNGGQINSQSTIYGYYFRKWLGIKRGVEITVSDFHMTLDQAKALDEYDFCIAAINRGFLIMKTPIYEILRPKIKHELITLCGSNKLQGKEDLLLFMMGKRKTRSMRVFWGGDKDLLFANKPTETINILVDHQYYGNEKSSLFQRDHTKIILDSLLAYQKINNKIVIKHIGQGKVHVVTDEYQIDKFKQSTCMDFREIYQYYNEAHIYVVTHPEALGLSAIECGCAGAMIVQPNGYIKKEIIKKLYHYTIPNVNAINWDEIIKHINITKAKNMASFFSYEKMADQLYTHMLESMSVGSTVK